MPACTLTAAAALAPLVPEPSRHTDEQFEATLYGRRGAAAHRAAGGGAMPIHAAFLKAVNSRRPARIGVGPNIAAR